MELAEKLKDYDALVCGCDTVAMGAMRALSDAGIRIPEDILVMGYDGIEIGKYIVAPLSTIAQPFAQIGRMGAQVLMERIKNPQAPSKKIMYEGTLVERRSTRRKIRGGQE